MTIQFVYMDTIWKHITKFVRAHNNYLSRKQWRWNSYLATGRLFDLYKNLQLPVTKHGLSANPELLTKLKTEIAAWNPNIYLHPDVINICIDILKRYNLSLESEMIVKDDLMYQKIYLILYKKLAKYLLNRKQFLLKFCHVIFLTISNKKIFIIPNKILQNNFYQWKYIKRGYRNWIWSCFLGKFHCYLALLLSTDTRSNVTSFSQQVDAYPQNKTLLRVRISH